MQASDEHTKNLNMLQFAQYLIRKHGYKVFWVGVETSALQSATEKALYFFAYTALKEFYVQRIHAGPISTISQFGTGLCGRVGPLAHYTSHGLLDYDDSNQYQSQCKCHDVTL